MAQLTCENLTLGYDGKVILENLNFHVNSGDYLCIVGENGSGKTTLMKTILGLQSSIDGKIIMSDGLKQTEIGYLPQQSVVQKDFPASVKEVVYSGLHRSNFSLFYNKQEKQIATKAMQKMRIENLEKRCYRELSGGQQQRVLLARALCATQKMLLLDEPVASLDPKVTNELYQVIQELNQNDGITIVMISHDIETAIQYATHVLYIGSKVFFGTKHEYLKTVHETLFPNKKDGICTC